MNKLFLFFAALLFTNSLTAQTNLLETIGNTKSFYTTYVAETNSSVFYFRRYLSPINTLIRIEKVDKNALVALASNYVTGDTTQSDSAFFALRTVINGAGIHIVYVKSHNDTVALGPGHYSQALYYQQFDTSLNVVVPETRLITIRYPDDRFHGINLRDLTLINNKLVAIFFGSESVTGNTLSRYVQLDLSGAVQRIDTVPMVPVVSNEHEALEVTQLPNHHVLFTGSGLFRSSLTWDFVETDSNFRLVDTFLRLPFTINTSTISGGYDPSETLVQPLPSGDWIGYSQLLYTDQQIGTVMRHAMFTKMPVATRHAMDSVRIFSGKDTADVMQASRSQYNLAYNRYENRIYAANCTHSDGQLPFQCYANANYVQIISTDTNLNNTWRKFIYSGEGYCFWTGAVTSCVGRPGVLVTGYKFLNARPADTAYQTGFIYHIDSSTTTGIENPVNGIIIRDRFAVYPNPAKDQITVDDFLGQLAEVSITNMQGQVVYHQTASGGKLAISTVAYPMGLYLVRCRSVDGEWYSMKLVKE